MITTILGIGVGYGICYFIAMGILIFIGFTMYDYETGGLKKVFRSYVGYVILGIGLFSGLIWCFSTVITAFGAMALIFFRSHADNSFVNMTMGFGIATIITTIICIVCFATFKKFFINKKEEKIEKVEVVDYVSEDDLKQIKSLIGGEYEWYKLSVANKNKAIREFKETGTIRVK